MALSAGRDGVLTGRLSVGVVLSGTRLQALVRERGIEGVSLWGGGAEDALRFEPPIPTHAEVRVSPNAFEARWPTGALRVFAHDEHPVLWIEVEGDAPQLRLVLRRSAPPPLEAPTPRRHPEGWGLQGEGGIVSLLAPGGSSASRGRVVVGPQRVAWLLSGADEREHQAALTFARSTPEPWRLLAASHERLRSLFDTPDPLLRSMVVHGLHTAQSARKHLPDGRFAGYAAGFGYVNPARSYYRDAYWSLQALLPIAPERVWDQVRLLATGMEGDGAAPSAVILTSEAGERAWEARRTSDPQLLRDHPRRGLWWADHTDSPLYFVLLALEAVAFIGDPALLHEVVGGRSVLARIHAVLERLARSCDDEGMPIKPPHDRDWADNVFRGGSVAYIAGLAYGALQRTAAAIATDDPARARAYRARAAKLQRVASRRLYAPERRQFDSFVTRDAQRETHLAIDSITLVRYGLAAPAEARHHVDSMVARLFTKNNPRQPWGDWGVMCVDAPHQPWVKLRGKSRFAYRYHNGGAWPVWQGALAESMLRLRHPEWRYALTRWWGYGLACGWPNPIEYHSPPFAPGSPSNAWGAMPTAAALLGGYGLTPAGPRHAPPWGESALLTSAPGGRRRRITVDGSGRMEVEFDG